MYIPNVEHERLQIFTVSEIVEDSASDNNEASLAERVDMIVLCDEAAYPFFDEDNLDDAVMYVLHIRMIGVEDRFDGFQIGRIASLE